MNLSLQDRRLWTAGGVVLALLIVAASWLLFIHPKMSSTSSLRSDTNAEQLRESVLRAKTAALKKQYDNIAAYRKELAASLDALPSDSGLPSFTDQLNSEAASSNVVLNSIVVSSVTAPPAASTTTTTTPTGIYQIKVTLVSAGTLANQENFLNAVATGPRRTLISSSQLTDSAGSQVASIDSGVTITTQLTVFSAPKTKQESDALETLLTGSPSK